MAGNDRSEADVVLAAALAGGATVARAAEEAKVSERTVYRRLEEAAFCQLVAQLRARMVGRAVGRLSRDGTLAVRVLRTLALKAESEGVRHSAARTLLEFAFKGHEQLTVLERLDALERQWKGQGTSDDSGSGEQAAGAAGGGAAPEGGPGDGAGI
jgi:hypothetical protein